MRDTPVLEELTTGGIHWQVVPDCRERLFGPEGLLLDQWLRDGSARIVKHGPHRTVYRVTLPGLDFHLKHFRLHDTRAWLRELVRPSKARMEYTRARAVADRDVRTITPLALGEVCGGAGPSDSFLITRTLDDFESLNLFLERTLPTLPQAQQTHLRQRVAVVLGEFIARLHNAGIVHHDLHAGNLLLHLGPGDEPVLYLIDLHAVHLGGPLSWAASRANLVVLNRWFILRASRTDRLRFWDVYHRHRSALVEEGPQAAELARELERLTWASNLDFWRSRDRRSLVSNRYYERVHSATVVGHTVRDLDRAAVTALLADPDEPFRRPGVHLLKNSPSSTVAEFDLVVNGTVKRVIYKRFRITAWSDSWVALVRPSAALRSWVHGHGLRERCLPTPRPLAVWHRLLRGRPAEGYLLTEKVENAVELHRFVAGLAGLPAANRRILLRRCIDQLAALIRELHRRHLSHRDLKGANILVASGKEPLSSLTPLHLWLIDLVGVVRHTRVPRRRRVQNLARLHTSFRQHPALTRTDKLRFLRVYLQWGLFGRERWKGWWRAVEQATQAKVARNARSGRPLT
jgi:tRNA A-37 threonylcarbamoyl transferase component Bud32